MEKEAASVKTLKEKAFVCKYWGSASKYVSECGLQMHQEVKHGAVSL